MAPMVAMVPADTFPDARQMFLESGQVQVGPLPSEASDWLLDSFLAVHIFNNVVLAAAVTTSRGSLLCDRR